MADPFLRSSSAFLATQGGKHVQRKQRIHKEKQQLAKMECLPVVDIGEWVAVLCGRRSL